MDVASGYKGSFKPTQKEVCLYGFIALIKFHK